MLSLLMKKSFSMETLNKKKNTTLNIVHTAQFVQTRESRGDSSHLAAYYRHVATLTLLSNHCCTIAVDF